MDIKVDIEWKTALEYIHNWCSLNNCTKYGFINYYNLSMNDIGFLYFEIPSTRKSSGYGYKFRIQILETIKYPLARVFVPIKETIQDQINDAYRTNIKQWRWDIHLNVKNNNIYIHHDMNKPGCLQKFLTFLFEKVPKTIHFPIITKHTMEQQCQLSFITTEFEYY